MKQNSSWANSIGCFIFLILLSFFTFYSNAYPAPSSYFDTVQKTYIGYYQRAADPGGLIYWAGRLDSSGGNLTDIIEAFANSAESQALYGTINSSNISTVVNGIYNALFGRDAEAEGLNYYVSGFNSGQFTPATIMLNVLYGAQNEDLVSINNKLTAANLFTRTIDPELDGSNFQVTYAGDGDAIAGRNFLNFVTWNSATVPTQEETTAYIQTNIANPGDPIMSYVTDLLADAMNYTGVYPTPAPVNFITKDGRNFTVTAFPGQVQVFFSSSKTGAAATEAIQGLGGTVLSKIPKLQYYLAGVSAGNESAFITAIRSVPGVTDAVPNIAVTLKQVIISEDYFTGEKLIPLNVPCTGIVVLDQNFLPGGHGYGVASTITEIGGTVGGLVNIRCAGCPEGTTSGDLVGKAIVAAAEGNNVFCPGKSIIVNVSYGSDNLQGYETWFSEILELTGRIPADIRQRGLAVTFALGNEHLDLTQVFPNIRNDTVSTDNISKHFLFVGTNRPFSPGSNYIMGTDPDVVISNNTQATGGTSLAAPAVAAILQQVINRTGDTMERAIQACKLADDNYGQIELSGVLSILSGACGDGICDPNLGESTTTCPGDCPLTCGDNFCNVAGGELQSCPQDCPQNQCCINTNGCPSETPYECGASCCCCGWGQTCCWTAAGWVCCGG